LREARKRRDTLPLSPSIEKKGKKKKEGRKGERATSAEVVLYPNKKESCEKRKKRF
jgi:hypothetical protein